MTDEPRALVQVDYILALVITTTLVAGLLLSVNAFVGEQEEAAIDDEMRTWGQQVSSEIQSVDRTVRAAPSSDVSSEIDLPARVGSTTYEVWAEPESGDRYRLLLESRDPTVTVELRFVALSDVATGRAEGVRGTTIAVAWNGSQIELREAT